MTAPSTTGFTHIEKPPGEPARLIDHPRVKVAMLVEEQFAWGMTAEDLCRHHPDVKPSAIYAAMAYYHDHQAEIDHEIRTAMNALDEDRRKQVPLRLELRLRAKDAG